MARKRTQKHTRKTKSHKRRTHKRRIKRIGQKKFTRKNIIVPADVPGRKRALYEKNFMQVTLGTGKLCMLAADQKIEHLNEDFYGRGIAVEDSHPIHLFNIASKSRIGAMATHLGLIARYGKDFKKVPYIVKLNGKTNLIPINKRDPLSSMFNTVEHALELKKQGLNIAGIGLTVYLGSEYEDILLNQAAKAIFTAHQNGLLAILWMYPEGRFIRNARDPHLIAGGAGVAAALGADFVKVNAPNTRKPGAALREAVNAAGRTGVIIAGGNAVKAERLLRQISDYVQVGGAVGNAVGRNLHQRPLLEAVRLADAITAITCDGVDVNTAIRIYRGKKS